MAVAELKYLVPKTQATSRREKKKQHLTLELLALTSDLCDTCKAVSLMVHHILNYWYGSNHGQVPGGLAITIGTGAESHSPVSLPLPPPPAPSFYR